VTRLKSDNILLGTILAMVAFGIVMLLSASSGMGKIRWGFEPYHFVVRQFAWAVVAFFVMMKCKQMDYRKLNSPAWAFSGLGLVLTMLLVVYVVDGRTHRWFRIPGVGSFQPSEFAKPALIIFLAYFLARRSQNINRRQTLLQAFLAIAVLAVLVVASDLGTAMVPLITALVVLFVAGLRLRVFAGVIGAGLLLAVVAICSKGYRLDRVISFVDPKYEMVDRLDPKGYIRAYTNHVDGGRDASYQPLQSVIAVGAGGPFGMGLMKGGQKYMFLPEAHTDYIYASIAEELGMIGTLPILFGYLLVLWRGARLYVVSRNDFGRYLALGVTVAIVLQAFLNISVVLALAPTKGFPLPMLSFGGSSLVSTLLCMGLLLSVSEQEG
jgi:cell division protein FtsW